MNDTINKIIATRIMGLVEQVDFGIWDDHKWKLDDNGKIDEWAYSCEYHNGPVCERCYHSYCVNCGYLDEDEDENEKCTIEVPDYLGNENEARQVLNKINENNEYSCELYYNNFNEKYSFALTDKNKSFRALDHNSIAEAICFACLNALNIEI